MNYFFIFLRFKYSHIDCLIKLATKREVKYMRYLSKMVDKYYWGCVGGVKIPLIGSIVRRLYNRKIRNYASYIGSPKCFAGKPILPHDVKGIFVSNQAKIGKNCTIFQQVTIGSNQLKGSKGFGAPVIGDNCYIGAGAKIIGNVHVGNNCRIGCNAVVVEDVPDNCTVVCSNPRVIYREND